MINQSLRFSSHYFRQSIEVKAQQGRHTAEGFIQTFEMTKMTAIVIPASNNDLQLLPEGERCYPTYKLYTEQPLKVGDLVVIRGLDYKVRSVSDWSDYGYYNSLAIRHSETAKTDSTGFTIT